MTKAEFAQDSTDVDAMESEWLARVADMRRDDIALHWALLVDDAFETRHERLKRAPSDLNLYACVSLEGLASVAPRLVELTCDETGRMLLRRTLLHCSRKPMLSLVASHISLAKLKQRWEPLHWIDTEDGQRLLLRFADTRVLPVLPQVLAPAQWAGLSGALQHWLYVGRDGQPAACEPAPASVVPSAVLELSNVQLDAMMAASEPDTLFGYLQDYLSDVLPEGREPSQIYYAAVDICRFADAHGIDVWADRVALACADFMTTGAFRTHPDLALLLAQRDWPDGQLATVLATRGIV